MKQRRAKKSMSAKAKPKREGVPSGADTSQPVKQQKDELQEKVGLLSDTNRQLKRKVFDLYTIFEISRNFNAVLDYHLLLDTFIFTCLGQVGLLKGAIFLRRELDSKEFHMAKAKGSGDLPSADQSFQDDSRLVNYLKRLNRPVMTGELLSDFASPEETAILGNFQHGVVVPLIYKTHLAGLFLLADKMTGRDFTPDDIEFLSALGNQISVAIENARLYEAEKTAIQQLRAAQYQLVQTERLAALGEMSAKIAHEVNNPLGIIKNYVFLLKRETAENGKINEYAEIVGQEIDRIADIVGQLREFQRPVHMKMEAVDVCAVLEDTLKLMERQLTSSKISVQLDNTAERTVVMGRASALKQVFLNLTINARSAMEGGGTLTVTVQNRQEKLVIQVCDTGDGIAADVVPRIFDPFFTTKGDQGSGLGLSVCFGIMKSHAGSITYKDCNTGGCFELLLPLTRNEQKSDK